jgi:hypothetical protein
MATPREPRVRVLSKHIYVDVPLVHSLFHEVSLPVDLVLLTSNRGVFSARTAIMCATSSAAASARNKASCALKAAIACEFLALGTR